MKFWKSWKGHNQTGSGGSGGVVVEPKTNGVSGKKVKAATPLVLRRRYNPNYGKDEPLYEDFTPSPSPSLTRNLFGTTFVELIKRHGTRLGVQIQGGIPDQGTEPRIASLTPGSWAQRSDVLCIGDIVVSVNGVSTVTMSQGELVKTLDLSDRIQLEVKYPLPPLPPSQHKCQSKMIQVTLKKENGSFGMVIRGGFHENVKMRRPFTVVHLTPNSPTFNDGTIRVNDRIRCINGVNLNDMKLPELQSLLYQQDQETVFTVEYDVAKHDQLENGPILVEIRRDVSDILGFGVNKCVDSGHIFIESIKQASLADRCGAMHVGDVLLSVNGQHVARFGSEQTTDLIRGDQTIPEVVQLEILPGMFSRTGNPFRSSMPSPSFSSLRNQKVRPTGRKCVRYQSMTEIDRPNRTPLRPILSGQNRERQKFVTFTVELERNGGPLGLTLATEENAANVGPIFISALVPDGLAERTKTIQVGDQLVEINGEEVREKSLNQVIPMLQQKSTIIKLKLARLISIPERDFPSRRVTEDIYISNHRKPPLPSPSPRVSRISSRRDSTTSRDTNHSPTPTNMVALTPRVSPSRSSIGSSRATPLEVHKVTLFKDRVYEDFGFSLSDGLYEKGIFINRIRKGGPADLGGLLKPLDRILQINDTRTHDFDCCLAVPLIAGAGDKLELLVARATKIFALRDSVEFSEDDHFLFEDPGTLTRRSQTKRPSLQRTNSADGRLSSAGGGSITNHIVPWTSQNGHRNPFEFDDNEKLDYL